MKKIPIVYENDEILVIHKPAGLAVQGGQGVAHPLDALLSQEVGYKIHLVHRLDKETSGLLVVAKNPASASKWISLIASKQVKKVYTALCFGRPVLNGKECDRGTIHAAVSKGERELDAVTHFQVEEMLAGDGSLPLYRLRLELGTGRMHQIRIHLAQAKAPIAGDDKHGDFKKNKAARKIWGIKSLALCACQLTLPLEGEKKTFTLPPHWSLSQAGL